MKAENGSVPLTRDTPDDDVRLQVSALIDGELDEATADRAIEALLASDDLATFWADAHRAGDWMRSDEVVGVGDGGAFMRRFRTQLAAEPVVLAPNALARSSANSRSTRFWLRTGLPGASIAAALVAVVWVAAPFGRDGTADKVVAAAPSVQAQIEPVVAAAVTTAPVAKSVDPEQLSDYFAAHRDVTPFGYRGASARPAAYSPPAQRAGSLQTQ